MLLNLFMYMNRDHFSGTKSMRIRFFFHEVLNNHFLSILYSKGSLLDTVLSNDEFRYL